MPSRGGRSAWAGSRGGNWSSPVGGDGRVRARGGAPPAGSTAGLMPVADAAKEPLRDFLVKHGSAEERARFVETAKELRGADEAEAVSEDDLAIVIPAFVITELKEAFIIAFLIFLPFLVLSPSLALLPLPSFTRPAPPPTTRLMFSTVTGSPRIWSRSGALSAMGTRIHKRR